ncbi:probable aspartic proteinase GIP1 [Actinidia eriantha]|uniref:probable aspartic proteinase GIP1 n=1 Tax=Actinidia eriantha TaxID=165200 RepID=UPI00258B0CEA|nr:probable aspartic proteinase GIP1 [Actinidia eriantha]
MQSPMPSPSHIFHFLLLFFLSPSFAAFLAPITKDPTTSQYILSIYLKTPLQPTKLVLDLGASFAWVDCTRRYKSSSYHHIPCSDPLCSAIVSLACSNCFRRPAPGCANDSCALFPENSVTRQTIIAEALVDSLALPSTDGRNPGQLARVPEFVFSCAKTSLLKGIAKGVTGFAGLGRSNFSLPAQVSTAFSSPFLFALCLSGSPSAPGVAFFNSGGPYYFLPEIDLSKSLIYTPLILNPVGSTIITYYLHPSDEYFIGVSAIKVNGKDLQFNKTILTIDENGFGGTKISTTTPYAVLETSIYKAFKEAFVSESAALNLTVTTPVKPFEVCYSADDVLSTRMGPAVPTVDLVMQNDGAFWRIFGANSMVRIGSKDEDLWCLGFLDGGAHPRASIVIGGLQMEDNLLQFDLEKKRFGFSSSVLSHGTMCGNFNFTSNGNLKQN